MCFVIDGEVSLSEASLIARNYQQNIAIFEKTGKITPQTDSIKNRGVV